MPETHSFDTFEHLFVQYYVKKCIVSIRLCRILHTLSDMKARSGLSTIGERVPS